MTSKRSSKWFWSDWAGDAAVRSLTPAERGLWIDLIALASGGAPVGYVSDARGEPVPVEEIARFANCSAGEVSSLIDGILKKAAASRDRSGRLYCRRMVRDYELSVKRRRAGLDGAAATKLKWQTLNGVPEHLPGHVPRQTGRAPFKKERLTSSFSGTASADARAQESVSAMEESRSVFATSDDLKTSMVRKGWIA